MPDLDRELTGLLERNTPGSVAPFADVRARARRRARRRGRVAVIATVMATVIAALAVARLTVAGPAADPAPVPLPGSVSQLVGPPPQRITVDGRELVRTGEHEIRIAWIDRDDPATLVVPAGMADPAADPNCVPHTEVRVLGQDAGGVEIHAYAYLPADRPADVVCADRLYPVVLHRLALTAPLGAREVRDGASTVPVVDAGTILWPSHLPAGYADQPDLNLLYPRLDRRAGQAELTYRAGRADDLFIRQVDRAAEAAAIGQSGQPSVFLPEPSFDVIARPTVRGHPGVVFLYNPAQICLRWQESADLAVAVCNSGVPVPGLGVADLLAVAESLRARR